MDGDGLQWMIGGDPPFDVARLDPRRFAGIEPHDEALTVAGVRQYANYYTPAGIAC